MPRYIDADALYELIDGGYDIDFDEVPETKKALLNMIDYQETADVVERKRGKWIDYPIADGCLQCSVCGILRFEEANYCPNCGAEMKGEEDGHD